MSSHRKDRRARSRKRRASTAAVSTHQRPDPPTPHAPRKRKASDSTRGGEGSRAAAESPRSKKASKGEVKSVGEDGRPLPPWHPLPLSEILILVGAIATVIGVRQGLTHPSAPLITGIGAVAIGTVEVMVREHFGGYRSHTIILSVIPIIVIDSLLVLILAPFTSLLRIVLLALDLALFAALFRLLRARFIDAHREQIFQGRRQRG